MTYPLRCRLFGHRWQTFDRDWRRCIFARRKMAVISLRKSDHPLVTELVHADSAARGALRMRAMKNAIQELGNYILDVEASLS